MSDITLKVKIKNADGDYQEVANIIEFGEYNGEGGQLYQQIRSTP